MLRALSILIIATVGIAACNNGTNSGSSYEEEILSLRLKKDAMFFDPDRTILRPKEQTKFTGLRYFPVDSTFRFQARFERLENPTTVLIAKQTSGPVPYSHVGYVHIPHAGQTHRLSVFQNLEMEEGTAWIPFHDATSGLETYGGGRYLDIDLPEGDTAIVDFNLAYNPYCVYNAYDFNCAIPPAENRLSFAVSAGEKMALLLD
ncbi:MAG TPA: DUF1684 domain-containing protein [Rhodothermia bacterium]